VERPDAGAREELAVVVGRGAAAGVPVVEALELDREDRGLQRIEAAVASGERVLVLGAQPPAVVAVRADRVGELGVVRGDRAGIAERAEVLARVEAERRRPAP